MTVEWILGSTALILAVLLVRAALGRRTGARLRYGLWLLVLLRLLLPVSFGHSAASPANLASPAATAVFGAGGSATEPMAGAPSTSGTGQTARPAAVPSGSAAPEASDPANAAAPATEPAASPAGRLLAIWYAGMAVSALWFLLCNLLFYRELRRTRRFLCRSGATAVYLAKAASPCVFGLFRPAIYVTEAAAADEDTRSYVLLHEKTHLRHGDHLWAFFRTACLVLWWFHPLVWAAAIVSRRDGELCCDEAVLRAVGPERGADYGRTLLTLAAEKSRPAAASCIAATLDGGGRQLKARIRAIARRAKPRKWAVVLAALLAAAAVGCAFSGAAADEADPSAGDGQPESVTMPAAEEDPPRALSGPLGDAELALSNGVTPGMSYEDVEKQTGGLGEPLGSTPGIQTYLHGGILYAFCQNVADSRYWLSGFGSDSQEDFLRLGIGVGSSLEDVVALLGCDPAGDPGDNSPWQLYGTPGTMLSATVYPGEEDGRFLSVWTEGGGLQIQFDDTGRAVQISCYVGEDSRYPIRDASLATAHGLLPGMTYDEAMERLGEADAVSQVDSGTNCRKGCMMYYFSYGSDGTLYLTQYTGLGVQEGAPLGLTEGLSLEETLQRLGLDQVDPEDPVGMVYGSEGAPGSAQLYYGGDGLLRLRGITPSGNLLDLMFDRNQQLCSLTCSSWKTSLASSTELAFRWDWNPPDAQLLGAVGADDRAHGLLGAVLYREAGSGVFHVAYYIGGDTPYFYPVSVGDEEDSALWEYQEGTFRYAGGGTVTWAFRDGATGQLQESAMTFASDGRGNVEFTAEGALLDG